jgi:hypothetical protein
MTGPPGVLSLRPSGSAAGVRDSNNGGRRVIGCILI